ncbi:MAG: hypothetical protein K9N06_03990 [Candidatus Cloacimonetes bacterium]|nr:hypothetical protein [Candidatus Cloacimonadota bacterium]
MRRNLLLIIILLLINLLQAAPGDIPVTRNLLESEHPEGTYQDFLENLIPRETSCQEANRTHSRLRGTWLCVVEENLYNQLSDELSWWSSDLAQEEQNVVMLSWTGTSHADLKAVILDYYISDNIIGVFLLGELPVFWFEMWEDWDFDNTYNGNETWVDFPMDEYFADMDGIWSDFDNDGAYDSHEGEVAAEIAIGRLRGDNLSLAGTELEIIQNWFRRNNLYRNGVIADSDLALGYIDDDWESWQDEYHNALLQAYENVEMVYEVNSTYADDYRENRWNTDYEWIQVHVHSGPDAHYFYQNNGSNYYLVHNNQIPSYDPQALFYNLFCCSNARFTEANAMGSLYVLGNNHGLGSIGSTKTGSMLTFENFYTPLGENETLGESLRQWWNTTVDVDQEYIQGYRTWFYGIVLIGDPSLKTEYQPVSVIGDIDYNGNIEAFDGSLVLQYSVGLNPSGTPLPWSPSLLHFADCDGNGSIEAYDASLILQYFVGLIPAFPVE